MVVRDINVRYPDLKFVQSVFLKEDRLDKFQIRISGYLKLLNRTVNFLEPENLLCDNSGLN